MTGPILDNPDLSQAERIDQVCTAFEAAWKGGETPRLEDWLGEAPTSDHQSLLRELLLVEVHYRRRRGETVDTAEYRHRFPELDECCLTEVMGAGTPKPAGQTTVASKNGAATAVVEPASGTVLYRGDYELVGEIGRGGMGVVYRCRHAGLDRTLAVKVLLDRHADNEELNQRFLEEAQIMGQLQHPGVAPIHEMGQLDDGRPFFSMKLVQGRTLAEMLKHRESLAVNRESKAASAAHDPRFTTNDSRLLNIFEQVCQTVAYAHAQGILHRDLKPSNIMVGAFAEVQVMDWGLAKQMRNDACEMMNQDKATSSSDHSSFILPHSEQTAAGRVLGTAAYMAPEQARGEVDSLDERCDVFGLGAILCEILTGQPAFPGDSQVDSHRRAVKGDLSDAFARLDDCGAEAELVTLARQCLAADKEQRPRDAGTVAGAVADYQARVRERLRRAEIERAAAQVKAKEERKRRKVSLALASVVVASVLAGAGAGVWYYQEQATQAEAAADLQTRLAREQAGKTELEAAQAAQAAKLAERKGLLQKALTREFAAIAQQRSALMKKLGDPLKVSELLSDIDQWQGLVKQARESWKRAEFLVNEGQGLLDSSWATQLKKLNQQIEVDEQGWEWAKKLDKIRDEAGALVEGKWQPSKAKQKYAAAFQQMKVDVTKGDLGQLADQVKASPLRYALVAALDDWASSLPNGDPLQARLLKVSRGADPDGWRDQVRDPSSWGDAQKLKELVATAQVAEQTPQILQLLAHKLADRGLKAQAVGLLRHALLAYPKDYWLHFDQGNFATDPVEQVGCFTAALAVRPGSAPAHNNLGVVRDKSKDLDGAILCYHQAIKVDPEFSWAFFNLGMVLYGKKDLDGAIKHFNQVIDLDPKDADAYCMVGIALADKKDPDGAIKHYQVAIDLDPKHAKAHFNLGSALYDKKKWDSAIQYYHKAIDLDPKYAQPHNHLGLALHNKGDLDGALRHYRTAIDLDPKYARPHHNLGVALYEKKDLDGAATHFLKAIDLDPNFADPHNNLGVTLKAKGDLDGAVRHYLRAIDLDPKYPQPHYNLGNDLEAKKDLFGAIKRYKTALDLNPKYAMAHYSLANALYIKKDLAGAIEHYHEAIALKPNYAEAHCNLAFAWRDQGKLAAALGSVQKGHELGSKQSFWKYPSAQWIKQFERLLELEQKLPAILQGTLSPKNAAEQVELAEICHYTKYHVSAVRFFSAALAEEPQLAGKYNYPAARTAVLAATGQSKDADKLAKDEPARLRQQALSWLKAKLAEGKLLLAAGPSQAAVARLYYKLWQCDPDLASVRDAKELAKLPEAERTEWQALWAEVAELVNAEKRGTNHE